MATQTNAQKIEKLVALGVELSGEEKGKDLDALLAQYAPKADEDITEEDTSEDTDEEESADRGEVTVEYQHPVDGKSLRTFSLEIHGKDYKKVAKQFAEKFSGTLLK